MRLRARSLFFAAAIGVVASTSFACSSCKKEQPPAPKPEAQAAETAVPAPAGLVLEGVVRSPDAILASLRSITPLVPDKAGPLLANLLHVPAETGSEIDGTKPLFLVVTVDPTGRHFAFAASIKDPAHVGSLLDKAGLEKSDDATSAMTLYQSTTTPIRQVLAVRKSFLLAGDTVDGLKALAPYATRTMPGKPLPAEEIVVAIPKDAMRTSVKDMAKAALDAGAEARKQMFEKSKALGEKIGLLDAVGDYSARQNQRFVQWLGDAGDGKATLVTKEGAITLRGDLGVPDKETTFGKQVASWPVGDALDALSLPASSVVTFVSRTSEANRAEASKDAAEMIAQAFLDGPDAATQKTKIETFLGSWDAARGERTSGAILYGSPLKIGLSLRLEAKDAPALAKLIDAALHAVLGVKGVPEGLVKAGIDTPKWTTEKVAGIDASVLHVSFPHKAGDKPVPGQPEGADVIFGADGTEVVLTAGVGARDMLAETLAAKTDVAKSLAANAPLVDRMKELGTSLAGAALVLPTRIMPMVQGATVGTPPAPTDAITLSVGKSTDDAFVTIALTKPAVETLVKIAMSGMMGGKKSTPF
jgi:hypothetical protein